MLGLELKSWLARRMTDEKAGAAIRFDERRFRFAGIATGDRRKNERTGHDAITEHDERSPNVAIVIVRTTEASNGTE